MYKVLTFFMITLVRGYQKLLSPLLGPNCRFSPTCSEYTIEALVKYGPIKGLWLGIKRLVRCHPFNPGGHDPLP